MSNCDIHIETHRAKGRTQKSRVPKALDASFVKIDERGIEDLIIAAYKLSSHLNFYGGENVVMGKLEYFFWMGVDIYSSSNFDIRYSEIHQ